MRKLSNLRIRVKGLPDGIGRLNIVDSTEIRLPEQFCDWAFISKGHNAVKMHTRLVVVSPDIAFPDKIVPSTGTVSDFESSDALIEEADATYVMDRGYPSRKNLMDWQEKEISFVVRITKGFVYIHWKNMNQLIHPSFKMPKYYTVYQKYQLDTLNLWMKKKEPIES